MNFTLPSGSYEWSNDVFVDAGGIVNGDLLLGGGDDLLVVELGHVGPLAGVTGKVDAGAGHDTLMYRVNADSAATLTLPSSFEALGYELYDGAALNLTGNGAQSLSLTLTGAGIVTLDADLAQSERDLLEVGPSKWGPVIGQESVPENDLTVINRGTLTVTQPLSPYPISGLIAVRVGDAQFENAGTITVNGDANSSSSSIAILGGRNIINSGVIALSAATAVMNTEALVNSGIIRQIDGGQPSSGVTTRSLNNSGTISVDGVAVTITQFTREYVTVQNSGVIESRQSNAITMYGGRINNLAGGVSLARMPLSIRRFPARSITLEPLLVMSSWMTITRRVGQEHTSAMAALSTAICALPTAMISCLCGGTKQGSPVSLTATAGMTFSVVFSWIVRPQSLVALCQRILKVNGLTHWALQPLLP